MCCSICNCHSTSEAANQQLPLISEIIRIRADREPALLHIHVQIDSHYYCMHTTTLIHSVDFCRKMSEEFLESTICADNMHGITLISPKLAQDCVRLKQHFLQTVAPRSSIRLRVLVNSGYLSVFVHRRGSCVKNFTFLTSP